MNPEIFREYDIRGVVERDFDLADVEMIGRGYGTYLRRNGGGRAVVGRDCRLSSPAIKDALVSGLLKAGVHVLDLGICPTPVLYFALHHLKTEGGLMITASHNPPEYNGFKVCLGTETIFGQEIQNFRRLLEAGQFMNGRGLLEEYDIVKPYTDYIVRNVSIARPVRVAIDAGNGTGGVVAGPILRQLGCDPVELFFEMDGRFPNHEADPTVPKNMATLSETVLDRGLELGIGLDGDADRIGVVDEKGQIIYGDMLMVIFAREILREHPGATLIGEVKCSHKMYEDIKAHGGHPIMWRTGHSLIKKKLKEEKALLAGEMSGHLFFAHRYFGYDDAIYAACRLLEILSRKQKPISTFLADLPKTYNTPEIRVECPEDKKFQLVEMVKEQLRKDHEIIDVDGVRVVFPDGWGLLRASNTGPVLVLRFEAQSEKRLQEIRALVEGTLNEMKEKLIQRGDGEEHRPWGYYEVLSDEEDHKVKRIVVYPGQRLSLQRHQRRSEHWFVVTGSALVTLDDRVITVAKGQAVDIPQGTWHRVRNSGKEDLVFIEVQTGDYFGEDDIERTEDDYGRA